MNRGKQTIRYIATGAYFVLLAPCSAPMMGYGRSLRFRGF